MPESSPTDPMQNAQCVAALVIKDPDISLAARTNTFFQIKKNSSTINTVLNESGNKREKFRQINFSNSKETQNALKI